MSRFLDPTLRGLRDCGCCEGLRIHTPALVYNRPGLSSIKYRIGTHARFKQTMLARISSFPAPFLQQLKTRDDHDFSIALLDAWAMVADVLTFYQERLANESYLRTATERLSLLELARLIGYELGPGVAAGTYLAYTIDDNEQAPTRVLLPAGTVAQSVPREQDEFLQTFETSKDFTAKAAWNELRPRLTRPQQLKKDTKEIFFKGLGTNLQTGNMLLIIDKESDADEMNWDVRRVTRVQPDPAYDRTKVTLTVSASPGPFPKDPEVYVLRQQADIFGHRAPAWSSLPDHGKASYLGITDPTELLDEEKREWPDFVINAPQFPHIPEETEPPTRPVFPTPESIAEAVKTVTDLLGDSYNAAALMSIPDAVIKSITAVKELLKAIKTIGNDFGIKYSDIAPDLGESISRLLNFFVEVVRSIAPDTTQLGELDLTFDPLNIPQSVINIYGFLSGLTYEIQNLVIPNIDTNEMENLENLLTEFINKNPLLAPLNILTEIDFLTPFEDVRQPIEDAVAAANDVPQKLAQAVGAKLVMKVSSVAVEAAMNMPLPEQVRTPEMIASVAIIFAKVTLAVIAAVPNSQFAADPHAQINEVLNTLDLDALLSGNGDGHDPLLTENVVPDDKLAVLTGGLAASGIGIGSFGLASTLFASAYFAPIAAPIAPFLLTAIAISIAVAPHLLVGAKDAEKSIQDAVLAALNKESEILSQRRPRSLLSTSDLDLDDLYPKISPDSWLLLSLPDGRTKPFKIEAVTEVSRADFSLSAKVTRVALRGVQFPRITKLPEEDAVAAFHDLLADYEEESSIQALDDLYETYNDILSAEALKDFLEHHEGEMPVEELMVQLDGALPFWREVRNTTVFAQSKPLELAQVPIEASVPEVREAASNGETLQEISIELDRRIQGLDPGRPLIVSGVVMDDGDSGNSGELKREPVILDKSGPEQDFTRLIFKKDFQHRYRRDSVVLYANVAHATHGETHDEVLGSGDASLGFQKFSLKQKPLTYVSGSGERGIHSTLSVRVSDVPWHEANSLYELSGKAHAFKTQTDDNGKVTLTFGDGINGARLPRGLENVKAVYRTGIGLNGNAGADQITLLPQRPLGVRSVTNPLMATGGDDPEGLDQVRRNAPTTVLNMGRIVSLQDYEDFAFTFPGIAKALATWTVDSGVRGVFLTVSGPKGDPIEEHSDTFKNLQEAIGHYGDPLVPLKVASGVQATFKVKANLQIHDDYLVLQDKVKAAVEEAMRYHFSFEARRFGQSVARSEVIAVMQNIKGVVAVDLDAFYRSDDQDANSGAYPPSRVQLLAAMPQPGSHGIIVPAEVLVLDQEPLALGRLS